MIRKRSPLLLVTLVGVACGAEDPVGTDAVPDPARGLVAFEESCGSCHASRDAFDLAFFDFSAFDIVRRGVDHVDSATARDIVAYVESLDVERREPDFRAFQPGGRTVSGDEIFWREVFGTDGWPDGEVTVESLRALDLRDLPTPIAFPRWSSEANESDWMPERPLSPGILDAGGGDVRSARDAYFAAPSLDRLVALVDAFRRVTGPESEEADPVCAGSAAVHLHALECFEARRWVSSLAATHLLRDGELRNVPYPVAFLWWETGEAAVSLHFQEGMGRMVAATWLYMSSVFAPDGFPGPSAGIVEDAGYMGQFLQSQNLSRVAVVATLRRMVSLGPLHRERPLQAYRDVELATIRAPREIMGGVLEFGLEFLASEQASGRVPTGDDVAFAHQMIGTLRRTYEDRPPPADPAHHARIRELLDRVEEGLGMVGADRTREPRR